MSVLALNVDTFKTFKTFERKVFHAYKKNEIVWMSLEVSILNEER